MCDCPGESRLGGYLSRVGGQLGDRVTRKGNKMVSSAAKKFRSFTGLGDYKVSYNSLVTGAGGNQLAASAVGRALVISNKEYLGDLSVHPTTVGAFNATSYVINPGNITTFPWLNVLALQYDQYKPMGIVFEFRTTTTDSTTNSAIGSIIMATEYDVQDAAFGSKQDMLNSAYSNESKMSEDCVHGLECDPAELSRKIFFIRKSGTQLNTLDIRDYDMARFTIATQGGSLTAGTIIGSLYVHYEFAFYKEQLYGGIKNRGLMHQMWYGEIPASTPIGISWWRNQNGVFRGIDMGITVSGGTITIPRRWAGATFLIRIMARQLGATWTVPGIPGITISGATQLTAYDTVFGVFNWATGPVVTSEAYCEVLIELNAVLGVDCTLIWGSTYPFPATVANTSRIFVDFAVVSREMLTAAE